MGMSRRGFLSALGALVAAPAVGATRPSRLVVVLADGGWDPLLSLDPRPEIVRERDAGSARAGATEEIAWWGGLDVGSNPVQRPAVDAFFARWASRSVIVRGVWSGAIGHEAALLRTLTGTSELGRPDLAAIVGSVSGHRHPAGYVDLDGHGMFGGLEQTAIRVGARQQLGWMVDGGAAPGHSASARLTGTDRGVIDDWVRRRSDDLRDGTATRDGIADAVRTSRDRAAELRAHPSLRAALDPGAWLTTERTPELVADLLADDVCVAAMLSSGQAWDLHERAAGMGLAWNALFTQLDALVSALDARGILDDTLILVRSELGRTPWRNSLGGTDHWPVCTAMLIGGGLAGGRVVGATGDAVEALPVSLSTGLPDPAGEVLTYAHLAAGVLEATGIDASRWLDGSALRL
ncbi:MAG: hypothetical protein ACI8PZ_002293 [Myxococcota bacterium]|jgi:hypothetical protein